ncbi:MAG: PEP-CTERM sorting domain-containing protein [Nitrospirota bacterium]|jgi:hypothetical protein
MLYKPLVSAFVTLFAAVLVIFGTGVTASATMLYYHLDYEFSGGDPPQGATPWITAIFDDQADGFGANGVRLTMLTTNLVDSEFVEQWLFNFSGDATALTFHAIDDGDAPPTDVNTGDNAFMADGDGKFDIQFVFDTAEGPDRFTGGEEVVYDIVYGSPISYANFRLESQMGGGNGAYGSAAKIQAIAAGYCDPQTDPTCGSGWIGETEEGGGGPGSIVPEPLSAALVGTALLGVVAIRRKRA